MVAKAAWLTVEPNINLARYLAAEDPQFFPPNPPSWLPEDLAASEEDFEVRYVREEPSDGE